MARRVLKWAVPVDDHDHPIGGGPIVHVGTQGGDNTVVCVWTEESDTTLMATRRARVYGTGQPLPESDVHLGSVVAGPFVWHVYGKGAES